MALTTDIIRSPPGIEEDVNELKPLLTSMFERTASYSGAGHGKLGRRFQLV